MLPATENTKPPQPQPQPSPASSSAQVPNELHLVTEDGQQCFMWRSNQLTYIAQNRHELPPVLARKFGHLATKLDLSYNNLTSFKSINLFTNLNELILDNNCLGDDDLDFRQNLRLKTLSLNKNKLCDLSKLIISIQVCFPNLEFLSLIGNPFGPIKISHSSRQANSPRSPHSASRSNTSEPSSVVVARGYPTSGVASSKNSSCRQDEETSPTTTQADLSSEGAFNLADSGTGREQETDLAYQKYRYFIINHLPNLHFLDSSPIGGRERDAALNSCFWVENFTTNDGRGSSIIWGQDIQQQASSSIYNYNLDDIIKSSSGARCLRPGEQISATLQPAIGEDQTTKGQFSQQVKCQMVGRFAFARTLLWTLLSITSTNLVHCSGSILALSLKGLGAGGSIKSRFRSNNKRNQR